MISTKLVLIVSAFYFMLLFCVAFYADQRRKAGRSLVKNSYVYTFSIAVYCTSWTYYGSVGKAATSGLEFLPMYLGPTLIAFTWWLLLRRMVKISKQHNIVSIADFIACRYDRSASLGTLITLFAVFGIMPYIALQLKAVSNTIDILSPPLTDLGPGLTALTSVLPDYIDTAFLVALLLGLFAVLFGARHLDSSERHEGLVAAVALESLIKLVAFLAVGIFVTYGLFDGFGDIFQRFFNQFPQQRELFRLGTQTTPYTKWFSLLVMSMMAVMFLPRQFHIMVIENADESHIKKAMWRFPVYLFLINIFVVPIALGGLLLNGGDSSQADYFVLSIPLAAGHPWLALLVFIGGLSASAGMVMVSSVTLSTMILNHLILPVILRLKIPVQDFSGILINLKRLGIICVVFLGYFYFRVIGDSYALVNIGLISFLAATQFAPAMIGALFWRRANRVAATTGLALGFLLWFYTLMIPSFVRSGWLDADILTYGPFGISLLKPLELFELHGFDIYTHSLFWSLLFNVAAFLTLSFFIPQSESERHQAEKFSFYLRKKEQPTQLKRISKAPTVIEFVELMSKFIGEKQAHTAITDFLEDHHINTRGGLADHEIADLKSFTERTLAGSVGAAPARIILDNYLTTRGSKMEDVFDIFGSVSISHAASREQLSVLYETAQIVSRGADLSTTLDNILELLSHQFKFDLCVIRFLDEESMTLVVKSQQGMTSEHFGKSERNLNMETYIGQAFLSNAMVVVNDCDFLDKPISAKIIHREGITSFAHAPIVVEGQPVGVLSAFSRTVKGIFTEEFIALFENIAGQVGIAWRNARQLHQMLYVREQEHELQIAKKIQMSLLPTDIPQLEGISLAGLCVPAHQIGGDYYDFIVRDNATYDLVVADVSGHNIASALIMAEIRTFIHSSLNSLKQPAQMLRALNRFIYQNLSCSELFVTMFYLQYQPAKQLLSFSSAGHNQPLLWHGKQGRMEYLDAEGLIFGVKQDVNFEQNSVTLQAGDVLLLYTDGIVEAEDHDGNFFGNGRLAKLLQGAISDPPQQIIDSVMEQVRIFTGLRHFNDDISLVVMKADEKVVQG